MRKRSTTVAGGKDKETKHFVKKLKTRTNTGEEENFIVVLKNRRTKRILHLNELNIKELNIKDLNTKKLNIKELNMKELNMMEWNMKVLGCFVLNFCFLI